MRLCNALIQCSLLILLSLFIFNCYGQEHPNHVDPVSTKYAQAAITVAPLTKPIGKSYGHRFDPPLELDFFRLF